MSEAETMHSAVVVQVMQNAKSYHDIRISESRVIPKRLRVADYERPLVTVLTFGRSNIRWVDVEPQIFDVREPWYKSVPDHTQYRLSYHQLWLEHDLQ